VIAAGVERFFRWGINIMSQANDTAARKGFIRRLIDFLLRPSSRFSLAALLVAGCLIGIALEIGFGWALDQTNTEAFCISCHEMRDTVYQELKKTIHYSSRTGVRAICSDCHVPKEKFYKVRRKIQASNELLHKILGTIDTPEKFEAHRLELAEKVWASMKANDSHECRNCHSVASMDPHRQKEAARIMPEAMRNGATCIDCHKGIAHKLPKFPEEDEKDEKKPEQKKG
jgi:cytochrome c-type protein NapC